MSNNVQIGMRYLREDRVAIIDNGINSNLMCKEKIQSQMVIYDNNRCIEDKEEIQITDFQHGTFCALIFEKYNSDCILNSVRILDKNGKGGVEKIEPALEWCYQNNIKIVNLSFGTTNFNECEKLKKLINKYVYNGMIIVAATANSGFVSYPASFTNVIGVATTGSPLSYSEDYMQMGIDTVVPSEHIIKMFDEEIRTSLSNSYAAPYACALIANRLNIDKTLSIKKLKEYAKEQSHIEMVEGVYEPDWVYKAYVIGGKKTSRASYYFETISGDLNEIREKVDTIIAFSMADLEKLEIKNKSAIYLGKEDIHNIDVQGFFWSKETRQRQILYNHYQGNGLEVPVVILAIEDTIDEPLVDKETFEKAQERVKEISDAYFAKEFTKHPPNEKNLLKGKIVCGDCGKGMRLSPRTTKSYVYFCGTFSDGINPACSRHKIDQEEVNKAVFAQISNHMRCCIDALRVIRELNARSSGLKKYDVYEKAITRQRRELEKVNRKFSELYGDYSEHLINESEYLTLKQQYLLKSEALKKEIDNLLISQNLYSKNYKIDADWENLINKYLKCRKLNKELADAFVDKVQVFEDGRISANLVYDDCLEELLQVKNKREGDLYE